MLFDTIGTFKIYKKHKTKNDLKFLIYIVLYTIFIIILNNFFKNDKCAGKDADSYDIPWIFLVTPTYTRPAQKPELIRLKQSLRSVPNVHWIIIEDSNKKTALVSTFLEHDIKNYTHLNIETPSNYKVPPDNPKLRWQHPRGVLQRNLGLKWIRKHYNLHQHKSAVIYFMDDDNTYDSNLFEEMRYTNKVSVWPVGLAGGMMVERPLVNIRTRKVSGWNAAWERERAFPIDMAGFAFNVNLIIKHPTVTFSLNNRRGYLETDFLEGLGVTMADLEPRANLCRRVLVWHTKSWLPKMNEEETLNSFGKRSDDGMDLW